ncbi:TonB-dependent receptor [Alteromonas sp. 1_MG-2023]|uniref:TonB-dependent receptor n=1 Tax=Alteromonas sp. 1_MG-2023 TaxID=3062669 RepID=UPI0026E23EC7|nr:TonB-dependent receptor [Alteromonas sp. 1_MG-2023]MDO6477564.1 TonB-dependent receptor [Alteromonas sp. 1_MG-2023]
MSFSHFCSAENRVEPGLLYFEIPCQSASAGLRDFAQHAGLALIFPQKLVAPFQTNTLKGYFSVEAGLNRLLKETGLTGRIYSGTTIIVEQGTASSDSLAASDINQRAQKMKAKKLKETLKNGTSGLVMTLLASHLASAQQAEEENSQAVETNNLENIIVTGVRGSPRSVVESPTPIDVFSSEQLEQQGQVGLFESLRYLVPSLNLPQRSGGGTATFISSAGLRGLNPDQTLVLVNGKRRHKTALINTSTGLFSGSAGVDLNMIPSSAIKRIEVLRDGASAQYGSDAIAGVVNIILKDNSDGGRAVISNGQNFDRGDGEFQTVGINSGFEFGNSGFLSLSYDYQDRKQSNRAREVASVDDGGLQLFPLLEDGSYDPREYTADRMLTTNFGNFPQTTHSFALNAGMDLGVIQPYVFATYANRDSGLTFTYRVPTDSRNVSEIFPFGYRPLEEIREDDMEVVAGFKMYALEFDWDFSASYGSDETSWFNTEGLNASLGAASPTSFYLGDMNAEEAIIQFDATRGFIVNDTDLQVSFGMQYRRESFEIGAGEELSYADGNNGAAPGAQGFPGFALEAENDVSRNNINAYLDLAWDVSDKLFLAGAVRYEDFNDSSGDEILGKLNARYELADSLAFRASVSTGFRAPSIQQLGFRGSRGQFSDLDNDGIAETIVLRQTLPSTDPAADALGAEPLVPETSVNYSAGLTYNPITELSVTVDIYQIQVDDRIAMSTQFARGDTTESITGGTIGDEISGLLDGAGFDASLGAVNYFTNAIDTRSRGIDVVASWTPEISTGTLSLSTAFNYNSVEITHVDDNPEELSELILADGSEYEQFDRERLGTYTDAVPDYKATFSSNYGIEGWKLNLRATLFGPWTVLDSEASLDHHNAAKWIVDFEAGYEFENGIALFTGANNIFNTYPVERTANSMGSSFYDTYSPYEFTGGSWYARLAYSW